MSNDSGVGYEELVKILSNLPMTWYPALIELLVRKAYKKGVFVPGGVSRFVTTLEETIGKHR